MGDILKGWALLVSGFVACPCHFPLTPVWAMLAMVLSVTTVLTNSFGGRLLPKPRRPEGAEKELEIELPTMHCEGCAKSLTKALRRLEEVREVEIELDRKLVHVRYLHRAGADGHIREAVIEAGYPLHKEDRPKAEAAGVEERSVRG